MSSESENGPVMESPPGAECVIDGRRYVYFGGTSYLGLHGDARVIEAACDATRRYGIHTATSRSLFGNSPVTLEVERRAANLFGLEDAFYFVSGYVASRILLHGLADNHDLVLQDEASHYSLVEAVAGLFGRVQRFAARDPGHLEDSLRNVVQPGQRPLVVTDGVSPSLGSLAPLAAYCQALERYDGAAILVDDAHGVGAIGEHGRGTLEHSRLWSPAINASPELRSSGGVRLFLCGTLSKALGGFGGILPGQRRFIQRVRSASHFYDGASASPVPAAAASACALDLVERHPEIRQRLWGNVQQMRQGLRRLGIAVEDSPVPIIPIAFGSDASAQRLHESLKAQGILVPVLWSYSGLSQPGVLRVAVFATHTPAMIDQLLEVLEQEI